MQRGRREDPTRLCWMSRVSIDCLLGVVRACRTDSIVLSLSNSELGARPTRRGLQVVRLDPRWRTYASLCSHGSCTYCPLCPVLARLSLTFTARRLASSSHAARSVPLSKPTKLSSRSHPTSCPILGLVQVSVSGCSAIVRGLAKRGNALWWWCVRFPVSVEPSAARAALEYLHVSAFSSHRTPALSQPRCSSVSLTSTPRKTLRSSVEKKLVDPSTRRACTTSRQHSSSTTRRQQQRDLWRLTSCSRANQGYVEESRGRSFPVD